MKNDIKLEQLKNNEINIILDIILSDEILRKTFKGQNNTRSRLLASSYVALIKSNDELIGFIMTVLNAKNGIHEVDMGILENYRNKGYGTKALKLLKEIIINEKVKVEVQIKKINSPAIKTVIKNGFVLSREDEAHNYYTVDIEKKKHLK